MDALLLQVFDCASGLPTGRMPLCKFSLGSCHGQIKVCCFVVAALPHPEAFRAAQSAALLYIAESQAIGIAGKKYPLKEAHAAVKASLEMGRGGKLLLEG